MHIDIVLCLDLKSGPVVAHQSIGKDLKSGSVVSVVPEIGFRPYSVGCKPDEDGILTYERFAGFWGCNLQGAVHELEK